MAGIQAGRTRSAAFGPTSSAAVASLEDGLLAGSVMLFFAMTSFGLLGQSLSTPLRLIASTLVGPGALHQATFWGPVLLGLTVHYALATGLAGLFVWLFRPTTLSRATGWGLAYGLGVAAVMRLVVVPALSAPLLLLSLPMFVAAHVLFGLTLGFFPVFFREAEKPSLTPPVDDDDDRGDSGYRAPVLPLRRITPDHRAPLR